jgi:hypothetical protein
MTAPFLVETFVAEAKARMAKEEKLERKQTILKEYMQSTFEAHSKENLVAVLDAVVPASGSNTEGGQSVIHADDEMIVLWNQIPARFQSGKNWKLN